MPDELKPLFAQIKSQLTPGDDLVAKTLSAVRPKPARLARWAYLAAAFVAGIGVTALVATSLPAIEQRAQVPPSPLIQASAQVPVPHESSSVTPDPALYAGLFATLSNADQAWSGGVVYNVTAGGLQVPGPYTAGVERDTKEVSGTNTQVAGIDEGDIVKTDGSNIYVANGRQVAVIAAQGASSHQIATIDTSNLAGAGEIASGPVADMMITGTTLVVLVHVFQIPADNWTRSSGSYLSTQASGLKAAFYDISDPGRPQLLASMTQSGSYVTSRLSGETLYLVSRYYVPMEQADPEQPTTFVPSIDYGNGKVPLAPANIEIMPWVSQTVYSVVSAIDTTTRQVTSDLAVLGDSSTCYMSGTNLYLASQQWPGITPLERQTPINIPGYGKYDQSSTNIIRISLNGQLAFAAEGRVAGYLINQFALDEQDGNLRVVTTWDDVSKNTWRPQAGLWVLDPSLKVIGSLPKLVTNETVQSVRFDGPVAYIVTFRQRDPLFTVDLTKPSAPKVQGALKIPGFSSYLHPFGDGLLLGVGYDAKDTGEVVGLKLSMFGVTDPYAVTELATTAFKGGDTEAAQDHHACFVDVERGLIGFPVLTWDGHDDGKGGWVQTATWDYKLYSWNGTAFKLVKTVSLFDGAYNYSDAALQDPFARGLLIGDSFYVVTGQQVGAYDLNSLAEQAVVKVG